MLPIEGEQDHNHTQHWKNNVSVDVQVTNKKLTWSRLIASELGSALTLHATSSWAVELATCFADDISFSSVAWPCTRALAASHKLCVAAATSRAYKTIIIILKTRLMCEGHSINKLQMAPLSFFKIRKICNIHFMGNLTGDICWNFY